MNPLMDVLLLGIDGGGSGCRARLCAVGRDAQRSAGSPANLRFGSSRALPRRCRPQPSA